MLPSGTARPSAASHDKINGTQSLQHMLSAYKLSVYALQWLLPDTAQDSIIDVLGYTFDAITFRCQLFYTSWRTAFFCVGFQVEAPVTRRSPHRPGLEDFPHPVPRFRFFYRTVNHSGDTPSGARLCCPFGIKYYGLSLAGVTDKSREESQRALYLFDSFGSTIFATLSQCVRRQPPIPCSCL
jgi:hypothetical protein